jgi:ferredoxin
MRGFDYLTDVVTLKLDQVACVGCGLCTQVCPHEIFGMRGPKAIIRDRDECMECGACALNCPVQAITVDAGVGCASGMINRWLAGFNIRFKNDNSCC